MTEEPFLDELRLEEEELIDDYVAGGLTPDERTRFEQHFLVTEERRSQLRFARALGRYVNERGGGALVSDRGEGSGRGRTQGEPGGPTWGERLRALWGPRGWAPRAAWAIAAVAVVAVALWLLLPRAPRAPRTFAALTLNAVAADRSTGAAAGKVKLPLEADALRVSLVLPEGEPAASRYHVEMLSRTGQTERLEVERQEERAVFVVIPADRLARGEYALRLYAVGDDGSERRVGDSYLFNAE